MGILLFAATAIATIIPPDLAVDFLEGTGAYGQSKWTLDRVTAYALPENGELRVDFGGTGQIRKAGFEVKGGKSDNEFSAAGLTAHVPEPSIMLLLGLGLIGLAGVGRKLTKNPPSHYED